MVLAVGVDGDAAAGITGGEWRVQRDGGVDAALDDLEAADCVVTAAELPDGTGVELCREIRDRAPALPVVLVAGADADDALAHEAVRAGVTEYLPAGVVDGSEDVRAAVARAFESGEVTAADAESVATARKQELTRYETIVEAVDDLVFAFDEEGRFTFANEAHESMTGNPAADLVGQHPSVQVPDEDVEKTERIIRELLADDERTNATFEMEVVRTDGTRVPCEAHIALMTDDDGEFLGTAGIVRDVSDRKEHERLFRTLVEEANDGIVIIGDGEIQFCNEQMADLLDTTRERLTGDDVYQYVAPEDRERVDDAFWQRYEGEEDGARYEIDLVTTDGERVPAEVNTSLVSYGDRKSVV